jgi:ABC-type branched-subunit amino acid transport system ATPase component
MLKLLDVVVDIAGIGVLRGISAEFKSGATYAILGRNGAGKTTLLRTIMGFTTVRSGAIHLGDSNLLAEPPHTRAAHGIGYAPEERILFPTMTVLENLRLPCESIGLPTAQIDARVQQAVAAVPLIEPMLTRSASALSGGQGKMAALTRSLMVGTHVLLLDEPFQGLAPTLARQYAEALSQLHRIRPDLCVVITESNRSLLDRVNCTTLTLERGELKTEIKT